MWKRSATKKRREWNSCENPTNSTQHSRPIQTNYAYQFNYTQHFEPILLLSWKGDQREIRNTTKKKTYAKHMFFPGSIQVVEKSRYDAFEWVRQLWVDTLENKFLNFVDIFHTLHYTPTNYGIRSVWVLIGFTIIMRTKRQIWNDACWQICSHLTLCGHCQIRYRKYAIIYDLRINRKCVDESFH